MIIGVAIGAFIYGVVPEDGLGFMAGGNVWWLIPLAAVIGIPLYVRLETMLPVALALSGAEVAIGPIFAMLVGGAGASPPEVSMLAAVFKPKLLATFVITILPAEWISIRSPACLAARAAAIWDLPPLPTQTNRTVGWVLMR